MLRLTRGPVIVPLLIAAVFGALGSGIIWLGIEEGVGFLVNVGASLACTALFAAFVATTRAVSTLGRRSRDLGLREYREHRRSLRPMLLGAAVLSGVLAILVGHNYVVWSAVERGCEQALRTNDPLQAEHLWASGLTAMQNPLLIIPPNLLDLWGPNRCRAAAERHRLPLADPATHGTEAPMLEAPVAVGEPGRP